MKTTITALAAALFGFIAAWLYQGHKYGEIIATNAAAQSKAIAVSNAATLEEERKNGKLTQSLQLASEQRDAALAKASASAANVVRTRGLFVSARCPVVPDASAPTGQTADGSAYVRLSDQSADYLQTRAAAADELANYAETAHAYALAVDDFIDKHTK